jgi:hypothetical protein
MKHVRDALRDALILYIQAKDKLYIMIIYIVTSAPKFTICFVPDLSRPNATEILKPVTNSKIPYLETVTRIKSLCLGTVLLQRPVSWDGCFDRVVSQRYRAYRVYSQNAGTRSRLSREIRTQVQGLVAEKVRPETITVFSLRIWFTCTHCTL